MGQLNSYTPCGKRLKRINAESMTQQFHSHVHAQQKRIHVHPKMSISTVTAVLSTGTYIWKLLKCPARVEWIPVVRSPNMIQINFAHITLSKKARYGNTHRVIPFTEGTNRLNQAVSLEITRASLLWQGGWAHARVILGSRYCFISWSQCWLPRCVRLVTVHWSAFVIYRLYTFSSVCITCQ